MNKFNLCDAMDVMDKLLVTAYDEGYLAGQEDCIPPNVWVIFGSDAAMDMKYFHSVVGSKFAAEERVAELNQDAGAWLEYSYEEVSIDAV